MLPNLTTQLPGGAPLGSTSSYICDMGIFVPKLQYAEGGQPVYVLKPETCCGGCCISCNPCSGKGLIYMPFYFHDPQTMDVIGGEYGGKETPQIRKLWAGLTKECCSTADTFAVMFPPGIDAARKAGLLGLTFLLDFTVFERQQDKSCGSSALPRGFHFKADGASLLFAICRRWASPLSQAAVHGAGGRHGAWREAERTQCTVKPADWQIQSAKDKLLGCKRRAMFRARCRR